MDTFAMCRARIGAARLHLAELDGPLRDTNSGIQREAILDVIARGLPLNPDQSLKLSEMVMGCNFTEDCKVAILGALRSEHKTGRLRSNVRGAR